jgi:hypothetical protein
MDLKLLLEQESKEREWPPTVHSVRAAAKIIWERPLHRYYTDHSVNHSERIIEKLNDLTGDSRNLCTLSMTEVYILLAAVYLHDIGMQDERFRNGDLEQIRDRHHELTRDLIRNNSFKQSDSTIPLGLEGVPPDIVDVIALVAEAHRRTDLSQSKYEEFPYGSEIIRPRLLAALLRCADELDIDHRRVHMGLLCLMDIPIDSCFCWYLCYYVSGVQIMDGRIMISYRFPESCEHYENIVRPLVHNKIRDELAELQEIFWEYGVKVMLGGPRHPRYVPRLRRMSPEVENRTTEERRKYDREINRLTEEKADIPVPLSSPDPLVLEIIK